MVHRQQPSELGLAAGEARPRMASCHQRTRNRSLPPSPQRRRPAIREDHLRPCFTCDPYRYARFYGLNPECDSYQTVTGYWHKLVRQRHHQRRTSRHSRHHRRHQRSPRTRRSRRRSRLQLQLVNRLPLRIKLRLDTGQDFFKAVGNHGFGHAQSRYLPAPPHRAAAAPDLV